MKKKCTPQNNAIKIKTPVECPVPIVPIVDGCVDPFTYTWNMAVNQALLDDTSSVAEHFDRLIDKGLVASSATNVCCPDCTENPIYVLASVESFLKLAEFMGWLKDDTNQPCCTNVQASIETYLKYNEAWQVDQPECCKTDFESCLNQFSTIVNLDRILDKGVVEANGFDGNTLLCKIYELFVNTPEDLLQGATLSEVFDRILDKSFVAYCCDCNVIISSIETFFKWWEATGGCGTAASPEPLPA
jgi:hypothetical protein